MRQIFSFFLLLIVTQLAAQRVIKGKITDAQTGEALAFASVMINDNDGTISDFEGNFELKIPPSLALVTVSYMGYETRKITLTPEKKYYHIKLKPTTESLDAVIIDGKYENPAVKLMKRAVARKYSNNYRNQFDKAQYNKYLKFVISAETERIKNEFDTIYINNRIHTIDSSLYKFKKELSDKHAWLFETISEVYLQNGQEKNKVIATRTAGLKQPLYEFVALQFSEQSVYDDYYKMLFQEYLGPFSPKSFKQYRYEISDSTYIQGRPVIVVDYRNTRKPLISGKIYLDAKRLAIAKLTLNTYKDYQINAVYNFKYIQPSKYHRVWFPDSVHIKIKKAEKKDGINIGDRIKLTEGQKDTLRINQKGDTIVHTNTRSELDYMYADYRLKFFGFKPFINRKPPKYDLEIAPDAHQKNETFWQQITGKKHTEKEMNTYQYIDSIAQKENIEAKIYKYKILLEGYYPVHKYFDFDLHNFIDYNRYEGFRIKLGGRTSRTISDKWQVSGYAAYGFKDKEIKYAGSFQYKLIHRLQTYIKFTYQKDLQKSAGFYNWHQHGLMVLPQHLNDDKFYRNQGFEISLSDLLTPQLELVASYNQYDHSTLYPIPYHNGRFEFVKKDFRFVRFSAIYTPFSKYYLAPEGRKTLKEAYPKFYFGFEKNFPELQINPSDYIRIEVQAWLKQTWKNKNITQLFLQTGFASYQASIDKLFIPNTNNYTGSNPLKRFSLKKEFAFETMKDMEFADNFVFAAYFYHQLTDVKLTSTHSIDIQWQGKVAYGLSYSSNSYVGIHSLDKLYLESGIELNRLWGSLGLGFYYRFGHYAYPDAMDNLSIRLTLKPWKLLK